jgi:hypothetical protein
VRLILDGTVVDVRLDPLIGAIVLDEMRARWWRYLWSLDEDSQPHGARMIFQDDKLAFSASQMRAV